MPLPHALAPADPAHLRPAGSPRRRRLVRLVTGAGSALVAAAVAISVAAPAASAADEPAAGAGLPSVADLATSSLAELDQFIATRDRSVLQEYTRLRGITARAAARQLGYHETQMVIAWSSAPLDHQDALLEALTQLGVPYRSNASVAGEGFDCSGLTSFAWREAGVELYRSSGDQISNAAQRSREDAIAGDLVYYPGHVMMYLGVGDAIVHAITHGRDVELDTISARRAGSVRFGDPTG